MIYPPFHIENVLASLSCSERPLVRGLNCRSRWGLDSVYDIWARRSCQICALSERYLLCQLVVLKRFSIDDGHAEVDFVICLLRHLFKLLCWFGHEELLLRSEASLIDASQRSEP